MPTQPLQQRASDIALRIFTIASEYTTQSWRKNTESTLQVHVPEQLIDAMVIESMYFGVNHIILRLKDTFKDAGAEEKFTSSIHNDIIELLVNSYFEIADDSTDPEVHAKEVEEAYRSFQYSRMEAYNACGEYDATDLFREHVIENFLTQKFNINKQYITGYAQTIHQDFQNMEIPGESVEHKAAKA